MDKEPAVYDMSHYLEHRFAMPGEERLLIVATRHEDGTAESLAYHQQRARLFHSLEEIDGIGEVEFHESVDSEYSRETGYVWVDLALAGAGVTIITTTFSRRRSPPTARSGSSTSSRTGRSARECTHPEWERRAKPLISLETLASIVSGRNPPGQVPSSTWSGGERRLLWKRRTS